MGQRKQPQTFRDGLIEAAEHHVHRENKDSIFSQQSFDKAVEQIGNLIAGFIMMVLGLIVLFFLVDMFIF